MTQAAPQARPSSEFAESRARALRERNTQRDRAIRTVTSQARDEDDMVNLLSILGLDDAGTAALGPRLAAYVRQVARAVGVSAEATGYEVSDTATAYLGLNVRWFARPGRDLMLVWDERLGWSIGVETPPGDPQVVVAYLGGRDAVPTPGAVARFVTDAVEGRSSDRNRPEYAETDRAALADRMSCHQPH